VLITPRPSRGVVSRVALKLPGHPPKRGVRRYPPRGVLREWSRRVPGSCRGAVSPLTGGFPHIFPTSGPASIGTGDGVSPPPQATGETPPREVFSACPWGLAPGRHMGRWTHRFTEPSEPRACPIKRSLLAVSGGARSLGGTLVVTRGIQICWARPGSLRAPSCACSPPYGGSFIFSPVPSV